MDCSVLCWRDVALRKMRSQGVSGLNVAILVAYRGHPVDTAVWGIVDKDAIAIKPGNKAQIECGRGEVVKLVGPQTAYQVLDAIQRAVRGDGLHKYTPAELVSYQIRDCRRCPLQGFSGVVPAGQAGDGTAKYRVLWSHFFCHTGVPCSQHSPSKLDKSRRVTHEFFLPENAINFKQQAYSPHAAGSVGTPPARAPSWSAASASAPAAPDGPSSSSSSSPQKQGQRAKKRISLPSALAALLQVK